MQDVTHPVCPSWGRPFLAVDLILSCIEKGKLQHKGGFFSLSLQWTFFAQTVSYNSSLEKDH